MANSGIVAANAAMKQAMLRQRVLLALCAVTAILIAVAFWMSVTAYGSSGATLEASGTPFVERIASIDPGSPADAAGLRVGDLLDLRDLSPQERLRVHTDSLAAGGTIVLPIRRGGVRLSVPLTPTRLTNSKFWRNDGWDQELSIVGELWATFVAAMIAWRRRDSFEAQLLALSLVLGNMGVALSTANFWISPWTWLDAVIYPLGNTIGSIAVALLATYALQFGHPVSGTRRVLTWITYAFAGFGALQGVIDSVGTWFAIVDTGAWFLAQTGPSLGLLAGGSFLPLLCAVLALRDARDSERARLAWATGAFAVDYLSAFIFNVTLTLNVFVRAGTLIVDVAVFVAPLLLTYALLSRRLLDVGFVVNRAAVVAILSAGGIAAFVLIEWVLSAFFAWLGTTGVLAVNIAAAIVVGLLAPALYRLAGSLVDRVLFRRQYRAREHATRLVSGLPYVESAAMIAKTLTRDLCKTLELPSGAVFRRAADGRFVREEAVGWETGDWLHADDVERIVVQLTADRRLLRLNEDDLMNADRLYDRGAPALVFPLESRQELTGFVVYSIHADGIDLDPDERTLLTEAARQASRGYDALELAARVETAYQARMHAEAEAKETLRRTNALLERINEAQARFVPTEFLHFLRRESIADVVLGDSTLQTMSVLFSDIRAFTTIAETMAPPEIFAFLNAYLNRVGPLVREHNGFIDKYIGDAVMALFPGSADDALRAAVALQKEVRIFNAQLERERKPRIAAGVGIHLGQLMLGTVGERGRMETTVIADAVNVASRLESATKAFGCSTLISRATYEALVGPDAFLVRPLGSLRVKGKSEPVEVYECFSGDAAEAIESKVRSAETFSRAVRAFESGRIPSARNDFASIFAADAHDGAARYYLARCDDGEAAPRNTEPTGLGSAIRRIADG